MLASNRDFPKIIVEDDFCHINDFNEMNIFFEKKN